jgi:hypothetical protein
MWYIPYVKYGVLRVFGSIFNLKYGTVEKLIVYSFSRSTGVRLPWRPIFGPSSSAWTGRDL